jgi:hypothetical protein
MLRSGTEQAGFSIEEGPLRIHVRVWGFWDRDLAQTFPTLFVERSRAVGQPARLYSIRETSSRRVTTPKLRSAPS